MHSEINVTYRNEADEQEKDHMGRSVCYFDQSEEAGVQISTTVAIAGWDVSRFSQGLKKVDAAGAGRHINHEAWFQKVAQAVSEGVCTFEDFLGAYTDPLQSHHDVFDVLRAKKKTVILSYNDPAEKIGFSEEGAF